MMTRGPRSLLTFLVSVAVFGALPDQVQSQTYNVRPIIGVISQELSPEMATAFANTTYTSYIAASFVKFIESAGARVVPVQIGKDDDYYEYLVNKCNGFMFPGGNASLDAGGYSTTSMKIYNLVKQKNDAGTIMPIWAVNLGFHTMLKLEAGGADPREDCSAWNKAGPLNFTSEGLISEIFGGMSSEMKIDLETTDVTSNFHGKCVTPQKFADLGLHNTMTILSTSYDHDGVEYVSTVEHDNYPFYAAQYNPEKPAFEWANDPLHDATPHSIEAIRVSQALGEFFTEKARLNANKFPHLNSEKNNLIYNNASIYVGLNNTWSFDQVHIVQ